MLAIDFGAIQELEPGTFVVLVVVVLDVDGDSREILKPRGRPRFGELSGFQVNFCALAVLPSHPAFGSDMAWYTIHGSVPSAKNIS